MPIPYLRQRTNGRLRRRHGDPVGVLCGESDPQKVLLVSYDHAVRQGVQPDNIVRPVRRDADASPLPNGEPVDSTVPAQGVSRGIDDFSFGRRRAVSLGAEKLPVVTVRNEAYLMTFFPISHGYTPFMGHGAYLVLRERPDGKKGV